jgi:glycosyltransferase involved in cell wall biosynthesis
MPAYNEEENIQKTIEEWYPIVQKIGNNSKLVIVDDGSKDDTFLIMNKLHLQYPDFIPLTKSNSGHGATLIYAYNYALENQARWIFQTDSDGQTSPDEFWKFWENRNDFDFIIGSRTNRQDGFSRIIVTKILKIIVWICFGVSVKDANTPFRLMNSSKLESLLSFIPEKSFLSNVVISALAVRFKYRVKWLPITFVPRTGGKSFLHVGNITRIGIKAIRDFNEIRRRVK